MTRNVPNTATKSPSRESPTGIARRRDSEFDEFNGDRNGANHETMAGRFSGAESLDVDQPTSQRFARPKIARRTYTLDSAYAAVPALDPPRDLGLASRQAKEEKAERTIRELNQG